MVRALWRDAPASVHGRFTTFDGVSIDPKPGQAARLAGPRAGGTRSLSRRAVGTRRHARLTLEAWRIADELGWAKTYDAQYVALAHMLGSRLLTLDARLRRTARAKWRSSDPPNSDQRIVGLG